MLPAGGVTDQYLESAHGPVPARRPVRRRRQLEVERHHGPRRAHQSARLRVRRLRHQRRHLGSAGRLLDHGRRLTRGLRARRARRQDAGARGRLRPDGPERRRPLRQDGPQRHRVRHDAGVRRRFSDPREVGLRRSTCARSARSGSTAASFARGCSTWRSTPSTRTSSWRTSKAGSTTRAKAAGRSKPPSTRTSRRRSSPCRCSVALLLARSNSFSWRVLAALRNEFGGHAVRVGGQDAGVRSAPVPLARTEPMALDVSVSHARRRNRRARPAAAGAAVRHRHFRRLGRPDPPQADPGPVSTCSRPACSASSSPSSASRARHQQRGLPRQRPRRRSSSSPAHGVPDRRLAGVQQRPALHVRASSTIRPATTRSASAWTRSTPRTARQGNRIFYLATPPELFQVITAQLGDGQPATAPGRARLRAPGHRKAVRRRPADGARR